MTQEELADLIGIDWQHLSKLETGRCYPSFETISALVKIFDVDFREMIDAQHLNPDINIDEKITELLTQANFEQKKIFYKMLNSMLK